jgi:hypothetical protein
LHAIRAFGYDADGGAVVVLLETIQHPDPTFFELLADGVGHDRRIGVGRAVVGSPNTTARPFVADPRPVGGDVCEHIDEGWVGVIFEQVADIRGLEKDENWSDFGGCEGSEWQGGIRA